jgi:hypothetical protein
MATSDFFFPSKVWQILCIFSHKNSLYTLHWILVFVATVQDFTPKKKNTECDQVAEARSPNLLPPLNVKLFLLLSHNIHFSLI